MKRCFHHKAIVTFGADNIFILTWILDNSLASIVYVLPYSKVIYDKKKKCLSEADCVERGLIDRGALLIVVVLTPISTPPSFLPS